MSSKYDSFIYLVQKGLRKVLFSHLGQVEFLDGQETFIPRGKEEEEEETFISLGWLLHFFENKDWYP